MNGDDPESVSGFLSACLVKYCKEKNSLLVYQ